MKSVIVGNLLFLTLATPGLADTEVDLVQSTLAQLQPVSFAHNREYCGMLAKDGAGKLFVVDPVQGAASWCEPPYVPDGSIPVASFHTHGAFEYDTPAEFPSVTDVEADEAEGIDGYVATPGGRLWYIDTEDMIVSQICGLGCLPQDPNFIAGLDGTIAQSYTYQELLDLEAE